MKMDFNSISRQTAWMRAVQFTVTDIGQPMETQYGFCQAITATDSRGVTNCLNYFFEIMEASVDPTEVGEQFYDVKWDAKKQLFKCIPATPPVKDELKPEKTDWDAVNLGKCRTVVLCAMLQAKLNPYDVIKEEPLRDCINQLAYFCMKGEINDQERIPADGIE